jgi:hypothetical protein
MYTPEGKEIMERLWQETMKELSFTNLSDILDGLKTV